MRKNNVRMKKEMGFTLMELMVTIAVIGIAAAITIPGMLGWLPNYRLSQTSNHALSIFRAARLRAVKENANAVVQFDTVTNSYFAFIDNGANPNNGNREADEYFIGNIQSLHRSISISSANFGGNPTIIFNSRGLSNAAGNVTFAASNGSTQQVQVTLTGHSSLR